MGCRESLAKTLFNNTNPFFLSFFSLLYTLRGSGGDLVICEEFAHMDKQVWNRVVVPTLITGAAFIGITTKGYDQFNFVTQLIKLKDSDGKPLMRNINVDLCCEHCRRIGKEDTCQHMLGQRPYWHEEGMYKKIKKFYGEDDDAYLVETKGLEIETGLAPAFDNKRVDEIFDPKNYMKNVPYQKNVFIGIDPSGGGSKFAVVAMVYIPETAEYVMIGAESAKFKDPKFSVDMVVNLIKAIRKMPQFSGSNIVLIPESNYGNESTWIKRDIDNYQLKNVFCMVEDGERPGVRTNEKFKDEIATVMKEKIRDGKFKVASNFVVTGNGNKDLTPQTLLKDIYNQILNYSVNTVPNKDPHKPPKVFYGGKNGYGSDDHALAIQWTIVLMNKFRVTPRYSALQ